VLKFFEIYIEYCFFFVARSAHQAFLASASILKRLQFAKPEPCKGSGNPRNNSS